MEFQYSTKLAATILQGSKDVITLALATANVLTFHPAQEEHVTDSQTYPRTAALV